MHKPHPIETLRNLVETEIQKKINKEKQIKIKQSSNAHELKRNTCYLYTAMRKEKRKKPKKKKGRLLEKRNRIYSNGEKMMDEFREPSRLKLQKSEMEMNFFK